MASSSDPRIRIAAVVGLVLVTSSVASAQAALIDRCTGFAGVSFSLALPETWNGRFLFQGGGGPNGSLPLPLGAAAAGCPPGLARGFAVVSTDAGHQGQGAFDASFMQDQQANLDFAYAALGRVGERREPPTKLP